MTSYPIDSSSLELCLSQSFCLFPFVEGSLLLALNFHWNKTNKMGRFPQTYICHNRYYTRKREQCQVFKQCNWSNKAEPQRVYTTILQRMNLVDLKHPHSTWSGMEHFCPKNIWQYRTIQLFPYLKGDYPKQGLKY